MRHNRFVFRGRFGKSCSFENLISLQQLREIKCFTFLRQITENRPKHIFTREISRSMSGERTSHMGLCEDTCSMKHARPFVRLPKPCREREHHNQTEWFCFDGFSLDENLVIIPLNRMLRTKAVSHQGRRDADSHTEIRTCSVLHTRA